MRIRLQCEISPPCRFTAGYFSVDLASMFGHYLCSRSRHRTAGKSFRQLRLWEMGKTCGLLKYNSGKYRYQKDAI